MRAQLASGTLPHGAMIQLGGSERVSISVSSGQGGPGAGTLDVAALVAAARLGNRDAVRSMVASQLGGLTGGGAESIWDHDPAFSEADLTARAQAALSAVIAARAAGDPRPAWRFLEAALFDRERMQIELLARGGRRQVVQSFRVSSCSVETMGGGPHGDQATVRIGATGIPQVVDRKGRRVEGERRESFWHERLVLRRAPGATTVPGGSRCPACEAVVIEASAWTCAACGNQLPPVASEWLASTILPREPMRR